MTRFAELGVTSNFSFLRSGSHPDELVHQAAALGHEAVGIADRNTLAGVVRAHMAAKEAGIQLVVGARLVTQDRQGTSLLYAVDTGGSGRLVNFLVADCCRGRGDICFNLSGEDPLMTDHTTRKWNVLFICTGNSARSIFAETLLREMAGDRFEVFSAGTRPQSELNPHAVALLAAKGHDISPLRSKHISEFQGEGAPKMDFVFTVCDTAANEDCPPWPGQPMSGHWGQPDPVKATGTEAERRLAFQQVYGALKNRIAAFAALPMGTLDRVALQARVDDIGRPMEKTT